MLFPTWWKRPFLIVLSAMLLWFASGANAQAKKAFSGAEARSAACRMPGAPSHSLQEIVDASEALPAPLRADAMIRIADKIKGGCPGRARELLVRAFEQAEGVKELTAQRSLSRLVDSRAGTEAKVSIMAMDRLSLQSRTVLSLASFRPHDALRLFRRIYAPRPAAAGCSSLEVPEVSIYYRAFDSVAEIVRKDAGQTAASREEAIFELLQNMVDATTAPEQLEPLLQSLKNAAISENELSQLLNSLAVRVESFPVDDRSLTTTGPHIAETINKLAHLAGRNANYPLLHAFAKYLRNSLQGPHCSYVAKNGIQAMPIYEAFNQTLAGKDSGIDVLPLNQASAAVEKSGDETAYWSSKKSGELLMEAKHLSFDNSWVKYVNDQSSSSEWRARIDTILNDIHNWQESDENNAGDYYHEKCILINGILTKLPAGDPIYGKALEDLVSTFEGSSLQNDRPAEWYWEIAMTVRSSKRMTSDAPQKVLAALGRSRNGYLPAAVVLLSVLE